MIQLIELATLNSYTGLSLKWYLSLLIQGILQRVRVLIKIQLLLIKKLTEASI